MALAGHFITRDMRKQTINFNALEHVSRRDFPSGQAPTCLYCGRRLKMSLLGDGTCGNDKPVLDHLDGDRTNNAYSNLALVHQGCNQAKRTHTGYILVARNKIAENAKYVTPPSEKAPRSKQVWRGHVIHNAVKKYLGREVYGTRTALLRDVCNSVAYQVYEQYGFGSSWGVRRHVNILCSKESQWMIDTDDRGRKVVSRRVGGSAVGGDDKPAPSDRPDV